MAFRFLITKFNLKTPGREENIEDVRLHSKKEYLESKKETSEENVNELIIEGLGGLKNIVDVNNCATRLRVSLKDGNQIDKSILTASGATGTFAKGNNIQVIYGPRVVNIKAELVKYMESLSKESE